MSKKEYLGIVVNDRGFVNKPPQMSVISPTLRAQDHGNPPKVIEVAEGLHGTIVDDTYGYDDRDRIYPQEAPTLRSQRQGLKVIEKQIKDRCIEVVGTLENSGTTQEHNNRVHSTDGISPTLTAVAGGTHHIKIFDPRRYRVRKLTPNEYGRLQAFPIDNGWEQVVSDTQAYKQFGNAVTTTVAQSVAEAVKAYLQEIDTGGTPNGKEELPHD